MASIERYVVERNATQVRTAFAGIVKLVKEKGITRVTLVVPKKGGFEHTIVGEFLGANVAKALAKGQSVTLVEGVTMGLESPQTFRPTAGQGLLVGAHIRSPNARSERPQLRPADPRRTPKDDFPILDAWPGRRCG